MNSIDQVLNSIETMHNGTGDEEEFNFHKANNNQHYIKYLMEQNFVPSAEMIELYGVYMHGKEDSWWCKASLSFREFINTIKEASSREARYTKQYRRGFSDGIRFLLQAMGD